MNFFVRDFKKFFIFLLRKKFTSLNLCLAFFCLLFLQTQGYYQTLKTDWQQPQTLSSNFVLPLPVLYPQNMTGVGPPEITAQGVFIFDPSSSVELWEKNSHWRFLPASTTKMMTALVTLEHFQLDDILTVPKVVDEGQDIKLFPGERMTAETLLYGLLVASANDAAQTLAASYPAGKEAFVWKMNQKAEELSLRETHFTNPSGLDEPEHFSSPFDLAILAKYAMSNPEFRQIVQTQEIILTDIDGKGVHKIGNINQLLSKVDGVIGVKTGWTEEAGECLVAYVERDGREVVVVVLGSRDRFGETEKLINWVFENFQWVEPQLNG